MKVLFVLCMLLVSIHAYGNSEDNFTALSSLVGEWKKDGTDGTKFSVLFELTAGGSVLVERWRRSGKAHSLTIYHKDGDSVVATHYCPQGNQPRLKSIKTESASVIRFQFWDVTDLDGEESHLDSMAFEMLSDDKLIRKETYRKGKEAELSSLTLIRMS